jgi:hypothetical protein
VQAPEPTTITFIGGDPGRARGGPERIIDHGAHGRTLPLGLPVPGPLTAAAKAIAGSRYHLDWDGLD